MSQAKRVAAHKKYLIVTCVIFCIYAVLLIFPEVWILVNSFKGFKEFSDSAWGLPKKWEWSNYTAIFKEQNEELNLGAAFMNSLILCICCPTAGVASTTFAAYALSKFDFRGRKTLYFIHILPMMVCIMGGTATVYNFYNKLNIYNTFFALIWSSTGGTGMNFLLVYGVFKNVSKTYMEAAEIDGASDWTVFFRIMLPQAFGIIGTLWMLSFIGSWNEYASYQLFLPSKPTISTVLVKMQDNYTKGANAGNYPKMFAAIIVSIIPVVALFLVFQEQIMSLSLGGGIKG